MLRESGPVDAVVRDLGCLGSSGEGRATSPQPPTDSDDWLKVNQFFIEQLAYIERKLDAIQEGDRTALDNSMLLFCSSMLTGHHDATQLPVVTVGRGGGQFETGRVLDYVGKPNRKMCSLYLAMMDKLGVHLDRIGDSDERLAEV